MLSYEANDRPHDTFVRHNPFADVFESLLPGNLYSLHVTSSLGMQFFATMLLEAWLTVSQLRLVRYSLDDIRLHIAVLSRIAHTKMG